MAVIKLVVGLKIPDTTAITAFHSLERLGFKELRMLQREDYYEFDISEDEDNFMKEIIKVDILVNANKHYCRVFNDIKNISAGTDEILVLVMNSGDNNSGLLSTLRNRMGFRSINTVKKGVLWKMYMTGDDRKINYEIVKKITEELLFNENYQEYEVI